MLPCYNSRRKEGGGTEAEVGVKNEGCWGASNDKEDENDREDDEQGDEEDGERRRNPRRQRERNNFQIFYVHHKRKPSKSVMDIIGHICK